MNNIDDIFSTDWRASICLLQCDKCDIEFESGFELIYTNYKNNYCYECYDFNDNTYVLMTSKERTIMYCKEKAQKIIDILKLNAEFIQNIDHQPTGG